MQLSLYESTMRFITRRGKSRGVHDREYQRKKVMVEKFIKKTGKVDSSVILNSVDIDYDTLMRILSELKNQGRMS